MKKSVFLLMLLLSVVLVFSCGEKPGDDSATISKLKQEIVELKAKINELEAEVAKTKAPTPTGTIKIGAGGVVSGDLAPYGISAVRGYELAIDDLNAKGGILGKNVELIIGDDVCKPEVAVNMAMKLVSDGAQMIVGHVCSGATIAANKIYKDAKLLVVSPASTNDGLTFSGENTNFFRTISYDGAQADLMTQIAIDQLKVKKVALIHDKGDYGRGQMELAKANFEKKGGVEVVLFEGVTTGAVDYTAIVQKIRS